jgi:O-antigen ligase
MTIVNLISSMFFEISFLLLGINYRWLPSIFILLLINKTHKKYNFNLPVWLIVLIGWMCLSCFWSPDIYYSFLKVLPSIVILIIGKIGCNNLPFTCSSKRLISVFFLIVLITAWEYLTNTSGRRWFYGLFSRDLFYSLNISFYNRAITGLAILFWPLWSTVRGQVLQGGFLLSVICFIFLGPSETSSVAFICGLLGYLLIRNEIMEKLLFWALQGILFLTGIGIKILKYMGLFDWEKLPYSLLHRFRIWEYFQQNIEKKILIGWGMDASHILSKKQFFNENYEISALHPHNSVLQIWFELGIVGIIIGSFFLTQLFQIIKPLAWDKKRFIYAQITTAFIISLSAFGFWQAWWLTLLWISAYLSRTLLIFPIEDSKNN